MSLLHFQVANVKKSLKSTQQDLDEQMVTDSREVPVSGEKGGKKLTKIKGYVGISYFILQHYPKCLYIFFILNMK